MNLPEKKSFPQTVTEQLTVFINAMIEEGSFFGDINSFPDESLVERGKVHLWNYIGEAMLNKHLGIDTSETFSEGEMERILTNTILQTNLDSLLSEKLIDCIENENGEMVYFMTEKGKEIHKLLGDKDLDC